MKKMKSLYIAPSISIEEVEPMTIMQASLTDSEVVSLDTNLDGTTGGTEGDGGFNMGGGGDGKGDATPRAGRSYLWDE